MSIGYAGALLAIIFFGTNYVPAKQYPTYDGMIFQWFMSSGILCVGLSWGLLSNDWQSYQQKGLYVFPQGLIGGALWAVANMLIPSVVNTIGLGIGFMVWNGSNIFASYVVSKFGLFGVNPITDSFGNQIGISLMLLSIAVFGLIKPSVTKSSAEERTPVLPSNPPLVDMELPSIGLYELSSVPCDAKLEHVEVKKSGIALALFVGCIFGNSLTPYVIWSQQCKPTHELDCNPLNFLFSQCLGIYIASTVAFLIYSTFHRVMNRTMPRSVLRPAYVSGVLWGIGLGGQMLAAGHLGYAQAYPLTSIGPALVSMLWSYFYFKEIQGRRNTLLLCIATCLVIVGVVSQALTF